MTERIHAVIDSSAPPLFPKLWCERDRPRGATLRDRVPDGLPLTPAGAVNCRVPAVL